MNPLLDHIRSQFTDTIQTHINAADLIAPAIAESGEEIVQRLLDGKKILCCGYNSGDHLASQFTAHMLHQFKHERPGLPVINLNANVTVLHEPVHSTDFFSPSIRTLGHPGDILLVISGASDAICLQNAIKTAQDKQMRVIALMGEHEAQLGSMLNETDLGIQVPSRNTARIEEMHMFILHCMCAIIDYRLFGHEDN